MTGREDEGLSLGDQERVEEGKHQGVDRLEPEELWPGERWGKRLT